MGNFMSYGNAETIMSEIGQKIAAAKTVSWGDIAFGGRNLISVLGATTAQQAAAALKAKSDARDYSGLRLGDWLEFAAPYGEYGTLTARYVIASMGQYHWFWDGTAVAWDLGCITFLSERFLFNRQIAAATTQRMYFTSPMNTFLDQTVAPAMESALGVTLKRPVLHQQYNNYDFATPSWLTDPDGWGGASSERYASPKVYLPSMRELSGSPEWGCPYLDNSRQFPLLAAVPSLAPAKNSADAYSWEWTRTPSAVPGDFCGVVGGGRADSRGAPSAGGCRPVFNL